MPNITPEMIEAARSAYNANTPTIIPRGGKLAHETTLMHTILSAALSAQPVVKPLEWRDEPIPPAGECLAPTGIGLYCIALGRDQYVLRFRDKVELGQFEALDAAKAAAQADYSARILSALSPAPAARMEAEREERDEGVSIGIAMSVAYLIRDVDQPGYALEWWQAAGLTVEQCERLGLDEYDIDPIRAALSDGGRADGR